VLELVLINTTPPNSSKVDSWNWVGRRGDFIGTDYSSVQVIIDGQTNTATVIGFKRRPLYAPQAAWDLRIANSLYLQLSNNISDGQSVQVVNDGTVWPANLSFAASMDPLRYTPAIHVNQEGYVPAFPKKARRLLPRQRGRTAHPHEHIFAGRRAKRRDGAQTAPYPLYDRWADFFNVTTEASTTDTARSLAVTAWLAGQTSLATQPRRFTNATIIVLAGFGLPANR